MQITGDGFHTLAQRGIRPHIWGFWASFPKNYDDTIEFGEWDTSVWDGGDLWRPVEDNPLQQWDYWEYHNYSHRIVDMSWEREIDFPYSVTSAIANVTINNYDGYFTPNSGSPIDQYILPERPIRLYSGIKTKDILQQFVGVTQGMLELDAKTNNAKATAMDWLSAMYKMPLNKTVAMSDVTTDEVIAELLQQFGLTPSQYNLAQGRNRIPYVFFERGKNAGNAFRELMQAEGGNLWLDEQGIVRFEQRLLPVQDTVLRFNGSNIKDIKILDDSTIINSVRIRSVIRRVKEFQKVWDSVDDQGINQFTEPLVVPANGTVFYEAQLTDPLVSVVTPTLGEKLDTSWFTALNGTTPVTSNVSISLDELRTNTYVMMFDNDNSYPVTIDRLVFWGEPAKYYDEIDYKATDQDSIDKYGDRVLDIENDFFGSLANARSFAQTILDAYADLDNTIELSVKGDPAQQLGDIIEVDTRDVQGHFKIVKITQSYSSSAVNQILKARHYEPRHWAFWDEALWDSTETVWAP